MLAKQTFFYLFQVSYQFLFWIVEKKQKEIMILSKSIHNICYALLCDYFYQHQARKTLKWSLGKTFQLIDVLLISNFL